MMLYNEELKINLINYFKEKGKFPETIEVPISIFFDVIKKDYIYQSCTKEGTYYFFQGIKLVVVKE